MQSAAPNWAEILTGIGSIIAAVVVVASAWFALTQVREAERTRLAALVADLSRRWDEDLLRSARLKYAETTSATIRTLVEAAYSKRKANPFLFDLEALPNFFEGIAVLEEKTGGLKVELVDALWGGAIIGVWETWLPAITYIREERGAKTAYTNFEDLYKKIKEYRDAPPGVWRGTMYYGDV